MALRDWWARLMTTARAAYGAWNSKALVPAQELGWDTVEARLLRYSLSEAYYNNIVYNSLFTYADAFKRDQKLYRHIRGVYNPVQRLVELYVSKVYGGTLDMQTLRTGAIPILEADKALRDVISVVWLSSNWRSQKSLYVRTGAQYGDVLIKAVDLPTKRKVRLEVLHPGKVYDAKFDEVGNIYEIVIMYEDSDSHESDPAKRKPYTYKEIITKEKFATFKDNQPFAFYTDGNGNPVSEWDNLYGFVPVVHAKHRDMGLRWGACCFSGSPRAKIDEVNDAASMLNDQIRKVVNPIWAMIGVGKADKLDIDSTNKDTLPMIYLPAGGDAKPLVAPIDISAASENIQNLLLELERDMPELALHRLREMGGELTAPGVMAGYSDASDRILEAQGNYDDALIRAHQMAISIGALGRYPGYERFDIGSYDRGDLDHTIKERPVFNDSLSKKERLDYLIQTSAPEAAVWAELGIDEQTIRKWQEEQANALDNIEQQLFGQANRMTIQAQAQQAGQQKTPQIPARTGNTGQGKQ